MAFQLVEAAPDRWRAVSALQLVAVARAGVCVGRAYLGERTRVSSLAWWRGRLPIGPASVAQLGTPRPVRRLAGSPRSRVWLAEFDGAPAVVKQVVGGADTNHRYAWRPRRCGWPLMPAPP